MPYDPEATWTKFAHEVRVMAASIPGLNPLWKQLRDKPVPAFPAYRDGFPAGDVMRDLGPLGMRRSVLDAERRRG